jgi:hypothetical protein
MTHLQFAMLVLEMRAAQRRFFAAKKMFRSGKDYAESLDLVIRLEQRVDTEVLKIIEDKARLQ